MCPTPVQPGRQPTSSSSSNFWSWKGSAAASCHRRCLLPPPPADPDPAFPGRAAVCIFLCMQLQAAERIEEPCRIELGDAFNRKGGCQPRHAVGWHSTLHTSRGISPSPLPSGIHCCPGLQQQPPAVKPVLQGAPLAHPPLSAPDAHPAAPDTTVCRLHGVSQQGARCGAPRGSRRLMDSKTFPSPPMALRAPPRGSPRKTW